MSKSLDQEAKLRILNLYASGLSIARVTYRMKRDGYVISHRRVDGILKTFNMAPHKQKSPSIYQACIDRIESPDVSFSQEK